MAASRQSRMFRRKKLATVSITEDGALAVAAADSERIIIRANDIETIGFAQIGDDTTFVHEGWWLLGLGQTTLAIHADCSSIERALRESPLCATLERLPVKSLIFFAKRPRLLDTRSGVVVLSHDDAQTLLRTGTARSVPSMDDFPVMT